MKPTVLRTVRAGRPNFISTKAWTSQLERTCWLRYTNKSFRTQSYTGQKLEQLRRKLKKIRSESAIQLFEL